MIEKLLLAIAAGIAAAELTKPQKQALEQPLRGFINDYSSIDDIVDDVIVNYDLPRGIRNNNPTNIRYDGTKWQGLDEPPSDGAFCRFTDARYGIRAAAKILSSYAARGLVSIEQIISTWAPSSENDTQSYINSVANKLDYLQASPLPREKWPELIAAIIKHENGQQPFSVATIEEGISWA